MDRTLKLPYLYPEYIVYPENKKVTGSGLLGSEFEIIHVDFEENMATRGISYEVLITTPNGEKIEACAEQQMLSIDWVDGNWDSIPRFMAPLVKELEK